MGPSCNADRIVVWKDCPHGDGNYAKESYWSWTSGWNDINSVDIVGFFIPQFILVMAISLKNTNKKILKVILVQSL